MRKATRTLEKTLAHVSRSGKEYHKFRIVLSKNLIKILGWQPGHEISEAIQGDRLVLTLAEPYLQRRCLE
jgi:hypothetical protein